MVTKRHPGGRPPLSANGSTVVSTRLSNENYDALTDYARLTGVEIGDFNISEFVRECIEIRLASARRTARP